MTRTPLDASKETMYKLRWLAHVEEDNAPFELYIPKWRVPNPWPGRIFVGIKPFTDDPSHFEQSPWDLDNLERPIRALVKRIGDHTRTVKYAPVGDQEDWQIGSPYIPDSLIPPNSLFLIIKVEWDLHIKWQGTHVRTIMNEESMDEESEYATQINEGRTTDLTRQAYAERLVQEDEHISGSDFKKRMHAEFPDADIQPMSHYVQTTQKSKELPTLQKPAKKKPVKSKAKKRGTSAMIPIAEQRKIARGATRRGPAKKKAVEKKPKKKCNSAIIPMAEQRRITNTRIGLELLSDNELADFFRIGTDEQRSIVFNELARRSGY